jgi:hypothetical protein
VTDKLIEAVKADLVRCEADTVFSGGNFPCGTNCPCAVGLALIDAHDENAALKERVAELEADPTALTKKGILAFMASNTPDEFRDGYYFPFKCFLRVLDLDIELLRGFLRSMRADGLAEFGSGFSEDGIPAGGGYSITDAGRTYLTEQGVITS